MSKTYKVKTIKRSAGAMSLTIGIVTLIVGIVAGILGIVNGGILLSHAEDEF